MKEQKRKFLGVWIPRELWLNEELSLVEKAMLVEINSLDNADGCWAGNKYFATFFKVSERMIRRYLEALKKADLIDVKIIGRTKRVITMKEGKFRHDGQKVPSEVGQKVPHNNTESNNTLINIEKSGDFSDKDRREIIDLFKIVNPSYKQLFMRKNQNDATRRMLAQYGREMLEKIVRFLPTYNAQPFNGTGIISPIELENKMGKLKAFVDQMRSKQNSKGKTILGL